MSPDPCPVGCGRPCSLGKVMCLVCWRRVPIEKQHLLYVLSEQLKFDPNSEKNQYAYQIALDRAIKAVPV
jgi:hypothetical protein